MIKKSKKLLFTITCVLMAIIMCFFTACSKVESDSPSDGNEPTINDSSDTDSDSNSNGSDNSSDGSSEQKPTTPNESIKDLFDEYELDDVESFVCSLIYTDLRQEYDTFLGYVILPDDTESYGICYTDYDEGYYDSVGKTYFSSGFISFSDEPLVIDVEINSGLEIHSLEDDDAYSYVLSYSNEDVHGHCVVYDKYVQYDIVKGELSYSEEDYVENMDVDFSRGNIYNYDIFEYVYLVEEIDYIPLTGVSLVGETDYQKIVDEVNTILAKQEANLSFADLKSYVEQSQDALISYILGLQEETFMGISTKQLVEIAKELKPLQHIQIVVDAEGNTTLKIIEIQKLPTLWEKILTSYICACSVVLGTVCNIVGKAVPGLSALGGLLVGVGIEVFSQVVISNTPVSDIAWAQVGVAAAAGAISGLINCKLNTSKFFNKSVARVFFKEVTDTLCDGIVGGTEFFANSLIAGQSFQDACKNFGYGMIAGVVISGGVKLATAAVKGGAKLVKKALGNSVSEIGGQSVTKLSTDATEDGLSELQSKVGKKSLKEAATDASQSLTEQPYSKRLQASSSSSRRITKTQFNDAKSVIKQVDLSTSLSSHIDGVANNHFDVSRVARNSYDSAFTNANRANFVSRVVDDLHNCQVYLKDVTPIDGGVRYTYWVKDSLYLEGALVGETSSAITKNYRLLIDYDALNGIYSIFDAFPEFRITNFFI